MGRQNVSEGEGGCASRVDKAGIIERTDLGWHRPCILSGTIM